MTEMFRCTRCRIGFDGHPASVLKRFSYGVSFLIDGKNISDTVTTLDLCINCTKDILAFIDPSVFKKERRNK